MYSFPKATKKTTWNGQGDLLADTIPYYGGGALGVCFGMSAVWISEGAPVADCVSKIRGKKTKIYQVQGQLSQSMGSDVLTSLGMAVDGTFQSLGDTTVEKKFDEGSASHIILEILSGGPLHYIVSYFYKGKESGGHAIGVSFSSKEEGAILDPNWGIGSYTSRSTLCSELHSLLASYCAPAGHLTASYLLGFENDMAFGDFVSF